MKRTLAVFLVFMFVMSALPADDNTGGPSGKYSLAAWELNGMDMLAFIKMMSEMADESKGGDPLDLYIEFQKNGKFIMAMGDGDSGEGMFRVDGKNVTLTYDGEELKGILDGSKFTIEYKEDDGEIKMVYEKK